MFFNVGFDINPRTISRMRSQQGMNALIPHMRASCRARLSEEIDDSARHIDPVLPSSGNKTLVDNDTAEQREDKCVMV